MLRAAGLLACSLLLIHAQSIFAQGAPDENPSAAAYPIVRTIPEINADGLDIPMQKLSLVDRNGWLIVSLGREAGEVEWEVVLARIDPAITPAIDVHPQLPMMSVQYGPWFVRDSLDRLRILRQPKDLATHDWEVLGKVPKGDTAAGALRLSMIKQEDWYWLYASPRFDEVQSDLRVRFQHVKLRGNGSGSMAFADGRVAEVFCGDARAQDEGDLFVASRMTIYGAEATLAVEAFTKELIGSAAPPLSATKSFPPEAMVSLAALQGKVVLLDFWGNWCVPCVKKLPAVNALAEEFGPRGLVVIGIHSQEGSEEIGKFLEDTPLKFPVIADDGTLEQRYAISSWPTYFLIGRDGKVRWGFEHNPPAREVIEAELQK